MAKSPNCAQSANPIRAEFGVLYQVGPRPTKFALSVGDAAFSGRRTTVRCTTLNGGNVRHIAMIAISFLARDARFRYASCEVAIRKWPFHQRKIDFERMSRRPPTSGPTPIGRLPKETASNRPEALLEALPIGAATVLAAAIERLSDRSSPPAMGLSESTAKFTTAPTVAGFEDSVRLQRLFASMDSEDRRQALLCVAEVLAAGDP
ncbi:MAG: hypothetical protein ACT4OU_03850 [Hyphomicrobium sp.]